MEREPLRRYPHHAGAGRRSARVHGAPRRAARTRPDRSPSSGSGWFAQQGHGRERRRRVCSSPLPVLPPSATSRRRGAVSLASTNADLARTNDSLNSANESLAVAKDLAQANESLARTNEDEALGGRAIARVSARPRCCSIRARPARLAIASPTVTRSSAVGSGTSSTSSPTPACGCCAVTWITWFASTTAPTGIWSRQRAAVRSRSDRSVRIWDASDGRGAPTSRRTQRRSHSRSISAPAGPRSSRVPRTARQSCGRSRPARRWSQTNRASGFVAYHPDGRRIAIVRLSDGQVLFWDTYENRVEPLSTEPIGGSDRSVLLSGRRAPGASARVDFKARVLDVASGRVLDTFDVLGGRPAAAAATTARQRCAHRVDVNPRDGTLLAGGERWFAATLGRREEAREGVLRRSPRAESERRGSIRTDPGSSRAMWSRRCASGTWPPARRSRHCTVTRSGPSRSR